MIRRAVARNVNWITFATKNTEGRPEGLRVNAGHGQFLPRLTIRGNHASPRRTRLFITECDFCRRASSTFSPEFLIFAMHRANRREAHI